MKPAEQKIQSSADGLVADIVSDIPVAAQGTLAKPGSDDDLDKIMHEVGHDLKQIGAKKPKRHLFSKKKKEKSEPKFSARPVDQVKALPAVPAPTAPAARAQPSGQSAKAPPRPAAAKPPKPVKTSSAPVGAIILALLVTAGLSAAAYYAYK